MLKFRYFGCDFDPNPDIDGLRRKIIHFLSGGGLPQYCGPYALFAAAHQDEGQRYAWGGLCACANWLTATPFFGQELYPEAFREYINVGNCRDIASELGDFVLAGLQEGEIPVTIGVDHCLTGGIYRALKRRHPNLLLVVFDMHLDAIRPRTRNNLVNYYEQYLRQNTSESIDGFEQYAPNFEGNYDTGSFLAYLIDEGCLRQDELMVLGIQDAPDDSLSAADDSRVKAYLDEYAALTAGGAKIVPLSEIEAGSASEAGTQLTGCLAGQDIYLSIDADVFADKLGLCTRYGSEAGLDKERFRQLLATMGLGQGNLVGIDIMETDVNTMPEYDLSIQELVKHYDTLLRLIAATKTADTPGR